MANGQDSRFPRRQNLHQMTATFLRDQILSGDLKPGHKIDQDSIAQELGVSRLPVREALLTLESEGIIDTVPRRGAFVAEISVDDMVDHYRMYGVISGLAAARLASSEDLRVEVIPELKSVNAEMWATTESQVHDKLNYRFHQIINKAGGSKRLISVLRILSANMPSRFFENNSEWEYKEQAFKEHDEIIKAIENGDSDMAQRCLEKHFIHTGEQAVKTLKSAGFWEKAE